jgi:hypothetical protein
VVASAGQAAPGQRPVRSAAGPRPRPAARGEHPAARGEERPAARGEHPAARGGEQPLPDRLPDATRQQGAASGGHEPGGHGPDGLTGPGVPGGMASSMTGPAGAWWPEHERLGCLLDDRGLFDGDDPVAPPVLGGRAPRPDPSTPWETR